MSAILDRFKKMRVIPVVAIDNARDASQLADALFLMAFLQWILNAEGSLSRELATGPKRLDLCANYREKSDHSAFLQIC